MPICERTSFATCCLMVSIQARTNILRVRWRKRDRPFFSSPCQVCDEGGSCARPQRVYSGKVRLPLTDVVVPRSCDGGGGMHHVMISFFVLAVQLTAIAQSAAPAQPQGIQIPSKPTCNPNNVFTGSDCQDRINLYNHAVRLQQELQLYVDRQKALASAQATAPQQNTDPSKLSNDVKKLADDEQVQIEKLQAQMQFDSALLQAKSAAHKLGLEQGVGIGAGVMLLLPVIFAVKKLMWRKRADDLPNNGERA